MTESLELEYKNVWKIDDASVRKDALELWRSLKALPAGQEEDRLNSLCVVAHDGDELAAVSTIGITYDTAVYAKVAWFRCLVKDKYRQRGIATELAARCKVALEDWAKTHPYEKVMGFGTVVESPHLTSTSKRPIWPRTGMVLVGHTQAGQQIRLVWFEHALLE
mmetsp:Transcript_1544/g.3292  ORF Transcript_1544/g.3292 Transcript_1544/m.3292 type:complete len:164 (+) Transcript_1544:114-605(+)|eukprot:CAMPEP_0172315890 /NCGR_PEP_ID=MMETSP1058-20130122/26565_1 /TAXON_ID=83371 /ORGANISM="Detonula confervacea, Strain CCMP 353" /LENGTH=163 /DNA_ID=CAMNT_0013030075 /DNA_START=56 /DNA_END=547 /DNA_ORIENTATION=-